MPVWVPDLRKFLCPVRRDITVLRVRTRTHPRPTSALRDSIALRLALSLSSVPEVCFSECYICALL